MKQFIVGIAVILSMIFAVRGVEAHARNNQDLAHRLAVRFGLNANEVEYFLNNYDNNDDKQADYTFQEHLDFIDSKLTAGVTDGWLTNKQKTAILAKLKSKMEAGPTPDQYVNMGESDLNDRIVSWRKEMSRWMREQGTTLDLVRNLTGKGNKYLMGIEL